MSYHFPINILLHHYHYINILIYIIYHISLYHNINLSLCALPLSVTMTNIHTTDTDWLPPHDTTDTSYFLFG